VAQAHFTASTFYQAMTILSSTDPLAAIKWRYAVNEFGAGRKIPADRWSTLQPVK